MQSCPDFKSMQSCPDYKSMQSMLLCLLVCYVEDGERMLKGKKMYILYDFMKKFTPLLVFNFEKVTCI